MWWDSRLLICQQGKQTPKRLDEATEMCYHHKQSVHTRHSLLFSWEKQWQHCEKGDSYLFFRTEWSWCWPASAHRGWNGQKEASGISCCAFESWRLCGDKREAVERWPNDKQQKYVNTIRHTGEWEGTGRIQRNWLTCSWSFSSCTFLHSVPVSGSFVSLQSENSQSKPACGLRSFHTSVKTGGEGFDSTLKHRPRDTQFLHSLILQILCENTPNNSLTGSCIVPQVYNCTINIFKL